MEILAAGIAGFFGAILRYAFYMGFEYGRSFAFPMNTFIINITGSFLLSFLLYISTEKLRLDKNIKKAVISGFVGSFTTFSSVMLEAVKLELSGHWLLMVFYLAVSIAVGIVFLKLGIFCGSRFGRSLDSEVE